MDVAFLTIVYLILDVIYRDVSKVLTTSHQALDLVDVYDAILECQKHILSVALNIKVDYITFLAAFNFAFQYKFAVLIQV